MFGTITGGPHFGESCVYFMVKNIGPVKAGKCRVDLLFYETGDGGKIIDVVHFKLSEMYTTNATTVTFIIPKAYSHKNAFRATIDPDDSVKESNEKNNETMLYQYGAFPQPGG